MLICITFGLDPRLHLKNAGTVLPTNYSKTMKLLLSTTLLTLGITLSAQMPGMMTMQAPSSEGTSLGANETLAYNGIAWATG